MKQLAVTLAVGLAVVASTGGAQEIDFVEQYALADDRAAALTQLIPGTAEAYYYLCLQAQNTGQLQRVEDLLRRWIKQHGTSDRVREIQHRQALLTYAQDPKQSLDYLRQQLQLRFDHQRESLDAKSALPTELDQALICRATLAADALRRHKNLAGFTDRALDWLVLRSLNADQRRHLLERLRRPDYPRLAQLILDDLKQRGSRGFGSLKIHTLLLRTQLDACAKLEPALRNNAKFVNAYLRRLQPDSDIDWRADPVAEEAYLERLWGFVDDLAVTHNSLKAHVLYQRLRLDRSRGVYDKARFLRYIQLPRSANYVARTFLQSPAARSGMADLKRDYRNATGLPPVGDDQPLVRSYLAHFFKTESNYKPYAAYIDSDYLKHLLAETKIVHGLGDAEQWYAMLPADKYQALRERVDLEFAAEDPTQFGVDEPVALEVDVKNVRQLIIKVFEINTQNYYKQHAKEVNTDIGLDGLVANDEITHTFDTPPLRRVRRRFEFPQLKQPGVYVIDLIGNGVSSRAVIRKGQLRYLVQTAPPGQIFTVLDGGNRKLKGATLWMAGRQYQAEADGAIVVPFTNRPGRQAMVLTHGSLSALHFFDHQAENYAFTAGIYVDREALLTHRKATILVRPGLTLNGIPVTLSVLEDVRLTVMSTNQEGVETTQEVAPFPLFEDRESEHAIQVPPRLAKIRIALRAKLQPVSKTAKIDLQTSQEFAVNAIDQSDKIEDLHLAKVGDGYRLSLLGKSGERRPGRPVHLELKHRDFTAPVHVTLQSDADGQVALGKLTDIEQISTKGDRLQDHTWQLRGDRYAFYRVMHFLAGTPVEVPYQGVNGKPARSDLSLLELRGNAFTADRFDQAFIRDGFLVIDDLAPGDYDLRLKRSATTIRLRVARGKRLDQYVLGATRQLEVRNDRPLQIAEVDVAQDKLRITLRHATPFTRVHLLANRFEPAFSAFDHLGTVRDAEPLLRWLPTPKSLYVAGRNIGDEYRYILDRKYAKKFPGNMLERPSLLLSPWPIRSTGTDRQEAAAGTDFEAKPDAAAPASQRAAESAGKPQIPTDFANLDFLDHAALVAVNLQPEADGTVTIERAALGPHQQLQIVAIDPLTTAYRTIALPEVHNAFRDTRLARGLDPSEHFTQRKEISVVPAKGEFTMADISGAKFAAYASIADLYKLYVTLSKDPKLTEFGFILDWPKLDDAQKRAKYSKYACHELNFFLLKKDAKFFEAVVRPHLANKLHQTFLDRWLLGKDLSGDLKPWNYRQLNVVERILLGQRIAVEGPRAARHIDDLYELLPPNVDRWNQLFYAGLLGKSLAENPSVTILTRAYGRRSAKGQPPADKIVALSDLGTAGISHGALRVEELGRLQQRSAWAAQSESRDAAEKRLDALSERQLGTKGAARSTRGGVAAGEGVESFFAYAKPSRGRAGRLYQKLDKTQEWVENNYYQLPIEQHNAGLVQVNAFWKDYAQHTSDRPFVSPHWAEASRNFTEMMFALALLDLPMEAEENEPKLDGAKMTLTAASPVVVFHEEIRKVAAPGTSAPILASQNFFRHGDRYEQVQGEKVDKFITGEFLAHTLYACHVVVTNTSSARQKLDVLLQIPVGAVAALKSQTTHSVHMELAPYRTETIDYYFYFPAAGDFAHFPIHVAKNESLLATAAPVTLHVVAKATQLDRKSWPYVSQHGSDDEVIEFLSQHNPNQIDLSKIAFRMRDKAMFERVLSLLDQRHVYNQALWSYGIYHNSVLAANEYLQHVDRFVGQCGAFLQSPLLTIDPVIRKIYQQMDYRPLVNARSHQLGKHRRILNDRLFAQYHRLMTVLSYRHRLDEDDLMSVTYYLLLQDRFDEALKFFARVEPAKLQTRLQYDYFAAYLDCYQGSAERAAAIAAKYRDYPVDRWRTAFAAIASLGDEIAGKTPQTVDPKGRTQRQTEQAAAAPAFEFTIEAKRLQGTYQNLTELTVNYYEMDLELLFSRTPFAQRFSSQFAAIRPNQSDVVPLLEKQGKFAIELPETLRNRNVLVEIVAAGQAKSQAYYANSLDVQLAENYGQLRVTAAGATQPAAGVYVKVYARMNGGAVRFYKDGYTDLRGRFDYTSLSTNEIDMVDRFALLILSADRGAVVREAQPPKR